jgi:hypothetical protein
LDDPNQIFLPAGSQHDAYIEIKRIVGLAKTDIVVVDNYVDGTLWTLLKNLLPSIKIRVLTMKMESDFALVARTFSAQHGNTVEIRKGGTYHDRFILLDGQAVWHLGAFGRVAQSRAGHWNGRVITCRLPSLCDRSLLASFPKLLGSRGNNAPVR